MRDSKGFDLWSEEYDLYVKKTENSGKYPFAGYTNILDSIFKIIHGTPNAKILDLGFGTAPISSKLYKEGYEIWGQDFSKSMLDHAKAKMSDAHLFLKDFSEGLDENIKGNKFDYIIATYCLHHLLNNKKRIIFLQELLNILNPNGKLLIGDVMFETLDDREACSLKDIDIWDKEENYFIVEEIKKDFPDIKFEKFSYCSGLLTIG